VGQASNNQDDQNERGNNQAPLKARQEWLLRHNESPFFDQQTFGEG